MADCQIRYYHTDAGRTSISTSNTTARLREKKAKVHSVHLMNVEQPQAAADPQTKLSDMGCESACRLLSTITTIAIYYYYSTRKLILFMCLYGCGLSTFIKTTIWSDLIWSFTVPRRVEGWVGCGVIMCSFSWFVCWTVYFRCYCLQVKQWGTVNYDRTSTTDIPFSLFVV